MFFLLTYDGGPWVAGLPGRGSLGNKIMKSPRLAGYFEWRIRVGKGERRTTKEGREMWVHTLKVELVELPGQ
jgi:hypothetical protein